jgi:hypothetical protein
LPSLETSLPTIVRRASDVYARILLAKGIGYPLWIPEPSACLPEYGTEGVSVGDVGVITFDGHFDFLFNIFLPPDHTNNRFAPPGFLPLPSLQETDVNRRHNIHSPGCVLCSTTITRQVYALGDQFQNNGPG